MEYEEEIQLISGGDCSNDVSDDENRKINKNVTRNSNHIVLKGLFSSKYLIMVSVLASTGGILFGYDIGVISGALIQLTKLLDLDCSQQEIVTSSVLIGAFLMSLVGGVLVDTYGRKLIMVLSSFFYILGAILTMLSPNYSLLVAGRLILGMAISLSSSSECVYVSEVSPANFRGTLVAFNELGITIGFLLAYCANALFASDELNGWRWMFGSSLVVVLLMVAILFFLPKSPRYLLMKGRVDEAKNAFCLFRQTDLSSPHLLREWLSMKNHITDSTPNVCSTLCQTSIRYSLLIAFSLMIIQQMTGQPTLLLYSSTVLHSFGFSEIATAAVCSVGLGVAKLVSTLICMSIIEKYDRKYFLVIGCIVMSVSLLVISISAITYNIGAMESCSNLLFLNNSIEDASYSSANTAILNAPYVDLPSTSVLRWVILFSLVIFVSAYAFSFGPVTWLYLSELFPTNVRGKAFSVSISVNWLFQLVISISFLSFSDACGNFGWPYLLNAIFTLVSVGFLLRCLPETKGKSLEEIQLCISKKAHSIRLCN